MFEKNGTPTILGLAACEWEAASFGIDGALDGDPDWQQSLNKMKEGNPDGFKTCMEEAHYFRFAFSCTRYLQSHWAAITTTIGGAIAACIVYLKTAS
jgi:hypothetical protein